jgi:hypothetical protein
VVGGTLLLFRRTTTLGALGVTAVMMNVLMINFCYDVPVKLYSLHLLLLAAFLVAPDAKRLANVLVLQRATSPAWMVPTWPVSWMNTGGPIAKGVLVCWIVYATAVPVVQDAARQRRTPRCEFYGIYEVEIFTQDEQVLAPLLTDGKRWLRLEIDADGEGWVRHMDNSYFFGFYAEVDRSTDRLTLKLADEKSIVMSYHREAPDRIRLAGMVDDAKVGVLLHRVNEKSLPLLSRKFRWTR